MLIGTTIIGVGNFFATLSAVVVSALTGWFISGTALYGWLAGIANRSYHIVAVAVFALTTLAAGILEQGTFRNPQRTRFVYLRSHSLWRRMLGLALLKGLAQGFFVTAPAIAHHASGGPGRNLGNCAGNWRCSFGIPALHGGAAGCSTPPPDGVFRSDHPVSRGVTRQHHFVQRNRRADLPCPDPESSRSNMRYPSLHCCRCCTSG